MNTDDLEILNKKYDKDFNQALNIYENDYSHEDLINFLKNGTVAEKQTAVLKLDNLKSKSEAEIFMNNLTGCDGKIREAVSFRLKDFIVENPEYFVDYAEIFLDAVVDINGNICRNTIFALKYMNTCCHSERSEESHKIFFEFCEKFCAELLRRSAELAKKAKNFDIQEGKYKINKEIFKLYWYLETICEFVDYVDKSELLEILNDTGQIIDYTIREKTAKILTKLDDKEFEKLKTQLKNDENYYVRRILATPFSKP